MKVKEIYHRIFLVLLVSLATLLHAENSRRIDSLNLLISKAPEDSNKVKLYQELGRSYDVYKSKEAIEYHMMALNLSKKINDTSGIVRSYRFIVTNLFYKGVYDLAITYYHSYEKFLIEHGLNDELFASYNLYGNLLSRQKRFKEASRYYHLSKQFQATQQNQLGYANALNNISILNIAINQYDSALVYGYRAMDIYKEINASASYANSILGIAEVLIKKGDLVAAKKRAFQSLGIYQSIKQFHGQSNTYHVIGALFNELGKTDSALMYTNQSLELAKNLSMNDVQRDCYLSLSKIHFNAGNYKEAYVNQVLYKSINDSINSEQLQGKMLEVEVKYDMTKKDLELERTGNQLNLQRKQQNYLIIGIVLITIMLGVAMYAFVEKRKSNLLISEQKKLVDEKQKEILDSIHYAKRIQNALIAHKDFIDANIPQHFIYFNPKDIVSGDFYWATKKDDHFYLAVCDSTGHGVPGAFMSLLNITFLNEAINEKNIIKPNEVFNYVRTKLIKHVGRDGQKDGFDGILICHNTKSNKLTYAAANNSPVLVSDNGITELPNDRMPVGVGERNTDFTLHHIDFKKDDVLYLYTDGFADQFGGPKGKKFKYKQLNELLLQISQQNVIEQNEKLANSFNNWRGELEQIDDVCVIGIRFS